MILPTTATYMLLLRKYRKCINTTFRLTVLRYKVSSIQNDREGKGFTLMEVVMYIALFGVLFGSGVVTVYSVVDSSGKNQARARLQAEGEFLLAKIVYGLSGVQNISMPGVGVSGSRLTLTKHDGSSFGLHATGSALMLQTSDMNVPINASTVAVVPNTLVFTHIAPTGNGVNLESVKTEFALMTLTPTGGVLSREFSSTTYVRK